VQKNAAGEHGAYRITRRAMPRLRAASDHRPGPRFPEKVDVSMAVDEQHFKVDRTVILPPPTPLHPSQFHGISDAS